MKGTTTVFVVVGEEPVGYFAVLSPGNASVVGGKVTVA
jgi:hypothetical protein